MSAPRVILTPGELDGLDLSVIAVRPEPQVVLMCTPDHFDVVDVKNAFMEGRVGSVDRTESVRQWTELRDTYRGTGHLVEIIPGVEGLEDMVFAANQVLLGISRDGEPFVVLSHMRHESRQREVTHYRRWFESRGYRTVELPPSVSMFEGTGDAIWHPSLQLLWGGYGHRTSFDAHIALSTTLDVPVIALELVHPRFYHLDTAFCVLSASAAMVYPGAFTEHGNEMLQRMFPDLITVSEDEASESFACNAHALDGRTVLIQRGTRDAVRKLESAGFSVLEVETGEYLKSGGSVYCMKQMIY